MELQFELSKPANFVFDHLSDMQKFVSVHPIIYKAEPIEENQYLIYERLKLMFIPANFTYTAIVSSDPFNNTVNYKARINALTNVEMYFTIKGEGSGCKVNEIVNFNSYLPIKHLMKNIFRKQHKLLFENINNL